ncbi:four helix bundle protein [bacterium]|nr:four helix bundle protein [bacterium]
MKIESHRDLIVWQKAMDLTVAIYELSANFPRQEMYRLTDQITRAAAAVPANIAEGHARSTRKDFAHFLAMAKGSLMETETFALLGVKLGYVSNADVRGSLDLIVEISKMLTALRKRILS